MKVPSRKLDKRKLEGSVDHIMYELEMLKETSIALSNLSGLYWAVKNALVESFVIHARGLIMFLYHSPKKDDDVMASDYFKDGIWNRIQGSIPNILDTTLTRANKEVAHITTFRIGKKLVEKKWDNPAITVEIFRKFQIFFEHVSESYMPDGYMEWFNSRYKKIDQSDFFNHGFMNTSSRST